MTKEAIAKAPSGRVKRKPVGQRQRLEIINREPGRVYRLIDSDQYRVEMFKDAGYRVEDINNHVYRSRLDQGGKSDNVLHVGGGKTQVLVSIEQEYYDEDQAAKQAQIDAAEAAIKKPSEGQYGKVSIDRALEK